MTTNHHLCNGEITGEKLFRNLLRTMIKNAQTKEEEGGGKTIKKKVEVKEEKTRKKQQKGATMKYGKDRQRESKERKGEESQRQTTTGWNSHYFPITKGKKNKRR
jgi:hypothetical protein